MTRSSSTAEEHGLEKCLLVGEVVIERAASADSGLGGDFLGAGLVISLGHEQSPRSVDKRCSGGCRIARHVALSGRARPGPVASTHSITYTL